LTGARWPSLRLAPCCAAARIGIVVACIPSCSCHKGSIWVSTWGGTGGFHEARCCRLDKPRSTLASCTLRAVRRRARWPRMVRACQRTVRATFLVLRFVRIPVRDNGFSVRAGMRLVVGRRQIRPAPSRKTQCAGLVWPPARSTGDARSGGFHGGRRISGAKPCGLQRFQPSSLHPAPRLLQRIQRSSVRCTMQCVSPRALRTRHRLSVR
jgi:hypothetical protein